MARDVDDFVLVGARFGKVIFDEQNLNTKRLEIMVRKGEPAISQHKYGDRSVIELSMTIIATQHLPATKQLAKVPKEILEVGITAGFVSKQGDLDGDIAAFSEVKEGYFRYIYWMLRERLTSIFSVTSLRVMNVPWELLAITKHSEPALEEASKGRTVKKVAKKPTKAATSPKR